MKIQPVRGTHDIYGSNLILFNKIKKEIRLIAGSFGFSEIITPIFENSELFSKPLGEQSDVVLKEMYSFKDRNDSMLTLRPEYTTPIIRSAISNNLIDKLPVKLFGIGPMFRRERPQKGRFRQFYQMNFEIFGSEDILADIELIILADHILKKILPNKKIKLEINSLGDRNTLKKFKNQLSAYFNQYRNNLSDDSQKKIETNPLRILDSKSENDIKISKVAPTIDNLYSKNAKEKFEEIQNLLNESNLDYSVNNKLVRGLDYYCHTVFEFKSNELGSQDALIGGGRYDGLIKTIGGPNIPGVGFAGGLDRLIMLMDKLDENLIQNQLIIQDEKFKNYGMKIYKTLQYNNIPVDLDYKYNLKKSLSNANKKGIKFAIIVGDSGNNNCILKDLSTKSQKIVSVKELMQILSQ